MRNVLIALVRKYPGFGGIFGWELFNSITSKEKDVGKPWCWTKMMKEILEEAQAPEKS